MTTIQKYKKFLNDWTEVCKAHAAASISEDKIEAVHELDRLSVVMEKLQSDLFNWFDKLTDTDREIIAEFRDGGKFWINVWKNDRAFRTAKAGLDAQAGG